MRPLFFFAALCLTAGSGALGIYYYVSSEVEYLKTAAPSVDGLASYKEEVRFLILGADGTKMYEKYYRRSRAIPEEYDTFYLIFLTDFFMGSGKGRHVFSETEKLKFYFIKKSGVDPDSLGTPLLNYYADRALVGKTDVGFRGDALRWHTLKKLHGAYGADKLYRAYLDSAVYGRDVYGIAAASEAYLDKPLKDANLLELAFLAAIPGDIGAADPFLNYSYLDKKARAALKRMHRSGMITGGEYEKLLASRVTLKSPVYPVEEQSYVDAVIFELRRDGRFDPKKESLTVYTGYDKRATDTAKKVLNDSLRGKDARLSMAFVLLNRETQGIAAVVDAGNIRAKRNRAIFMKRQMASTFKPIVYAAAFEKGFEPFDRIEDKPYVFKNGRYSYRPRNFENYFMGDIPIRYGLVYSLNNATVRLAELTGLKTVRGAAVRMGMKSAVLPVHAMALGAFPATPLNVAQIYSTLGNYGVKKLPSFITKVETGGGEIYDMRERPQRAIDEAAAFQTVYVMRDVAERGTARRAGLLKGTAAKTGTSDRFRDAWTAALFGPYVAVCWAGYDDYESMGENGSGGRMAAPVVAGFQKAYFAPGTSFELEPPESVLVKRISSGKRGSYTEALKKSKSRRGGAK